MTQVPLACDYQHLVSLNRFDKSINKVMDWVERIVGDHQKNSLFPTLIGIDMDHYDHGKHPLLFRAFLDQLGKIQSKYFVRFVVDVHWAMISDSGFLFYTCDGNKEDRCDIVWKVGARSDHQVDILMKTPNNSERRKLLNDLSTTLRKLVKCNKTNDGRVLFDAILRFYDNTSTLEHVHHLKEHLHILLLPNGVNNGFYPVPLYGMSYFDGSRREGRITQWSDFYKKCHDKIFTQDYNAGQSVYALIDLIRDNDKFGTTPSHTHETYNLAEMVFAFWSMNHAGEESNHDVILFNLGSWEDRDTTVYRYPMGT